MAVIVVAALGLIACQKQTNPEVQGDAAPTTTDVRAIAEEAYIFAFPMLENYKTVFAQALWKESPYYRAGLNEISHLSELLGPDFTEVVGPNNDTFYSFSWMDFRTEPLVLSVPEIADQRYYTLQLIDLYQHNFAYVGSRATGYKAGNYLIPGPDWHGVKPDGIDSVLRAETRLALLLGRTLVYGKDDVPQAKAIQQQYRLQPLSDFLGQPAPAQAITLQLPPYSPDKAKSAEFITYLNVLLGLLKPHPSEVEMWKRFEHIGIAANQPFDSRTLAPDVLAAIEAGVASAHQKIMDERESVGTTVNGWSAIFESFGPREVLQGQYMLRAAGAAAGLYGNDAIEASNYSITTDRDGQLLDGSKSRYTIRFARGQTPPVNAFWSLTMYRLPEILLVHNPIDRYSVGDRLPGMKFDKDGSLTLYVQHQSPGTERESNWLPAPSGQFAMSLRIYLPKEAVLDGSWKPPYMERQSLPWRLVPCQHV